MIITKTSVLEKGLFACLQDKLKIEQSASLRPNETKKLVEYSENFFDPNFYKHLNISTIDFAAFEAFIKNNSKKSQRSRSRPGN